MYTKSQNLANFGLTCIPEKGHRFVTVRAVTANLVSKDARTYRAKRLGGGGGEFRPSLFRVNEEQE